MDNSETPIPQKMKMSPAKVGVVIGAIFGMLGTASGFYFGVVRPALFSRQEHALPIHSIWTGIILLTVLIAVCGIYLWRWIRGPTPPPPDQNEADW